MLTPGTQRTWIYGREGMWLMCWTRHQRLENVLEAEWIEYIPPLFERPDDHRPYWVKTDCEYCGYHPRKSCFSCA